MRQGNTWENRQILGKIGVRDSNPPMTAGSQHFHWGSCRSHHLEFSSACDFQKTNKRIWMVFFSCHLMSKTLGNIGTQIQTEKQTCVGVRCSNTCSAKRESAPNTWFYPGSQLSNWLYTLENEQWNVNFTLWRQDSTHNLNNLTDLRMS